MRIGSTPLIVIISLGLTACGSTTEVTGPVSAQQDISTESVPNEVRSLPGKKNPLIGSWEGSIVSGADSEGNFVIEQLSLTFNEDGSCSGGAKGDLPHCVRYVLMGNAAAMSGLSLSGDHAGVYRILGNIAVSTDGGTLYFTTGDQAAIAELHRQ